MRVFFLVSFLGLAIDSASAQDCDSPHADRYPVQGPCNGGWDRMLEDRRAATYNCDGEYSNSDYIASGGSAHHGNDLFAPFRAPILAVVDGVVAKSGWDTGLGNRVAIHDSCGWEYDSGHLDEIAAGMVIGREVRAGEIIGYMGSTGSRSGGSVHLHFNIHHSDNSWSNDVNPFPIIDPVANTSCLPAGSAALRFAAAFSAQSFPYAADDFILVPGQAVPGYIEMRNTGSETWLPGSTHLRTSEPRDGASPLVGPDWLAPNHPTTVDREVPTGEVGRFSFTVVAPAAPGDYPQYFNLVGGDSEWFGDFGGPPDDQLQVRVTVTEAPDEDGDGSPSNLDCDDADATRHPSAADPCGDGVDQDCDGSDACAEADGGSTPGLDGGTAPGGEMSGGCSAGGSAIAFAWLPIALAIGAWRRRVR
jgi:murein DD-endopeptidase MepM/ murein hydrolase activator NlpD